MTTPHAVTARLEALGANRAIWRLVVLLSLGGFFEFYDLFLTAYVSPGLVRAGLFREHGLLGLPDQAFFASATFAGLFVGTLFCARIADRYGRRAVFTWAMLWYSALAMLMAWQQQGWLIHLCRFLAGIGIGVELVTIDTFLVELLPDAVRGPGFAINQAIQFSAVPVVAVLSWFLVDRTPWGIAGWRWVVMAGAVGAVAVWWLRRSLPESPRWLASKGRLDEAQVVLCNLEAGNGPHHRNGTTEPMPEAVAAQNATAPPRRQASMWQPPYLRRTVMLVIFNFCQTVGFYGFSNWLPTFMAAHGHGETGGLLHALPITVVYPLSPLLCLPLAKHFERKWLIVAGSLGTSMLGLGFAASSLVWMQVLLGALIVVSNNLMSFAYHAYQAELYPTSIRARAVGFVYAWSRLSTVFTSLMIGFFLGRFGVVGAFGFITANMLTVAGVIAWLGPASRGRSLETLSPEG